MLNRYILWIFLILLLPIQSWAILDLHVQEMIRVYKRPKKRARAISRLVRGDVVLISKKKYGAFRKILITYRGRKRAAYIRSDDIQASYIEKRGRGGGRSKGGGLAYSQSMGMGFSIVGSFLQQGERQIQTSSGEQWDISGLESFSNYFSLFTDFPLRPTFTMRAYLSFRATNFSGNAKIADSTNSSGGGIVLDQTLFGIGGLMKFYSTKQSQFWYGLGLELAKGSTVSLKLGNSTVQTEENDLPFFIATTGVIGWDIPLFKSFYVIPEARLGGIFNTDPYMMMAEVYISTAYAYW